MHPRILKIGEIVQLGSHLPVGVPPHWREFERGGDDDGFLQIPALQNWIGPGVYIGISSHPHSKEADCEAVDDRNPRELRCVTPAETREKKSRKQGKAQRGANAIAKLKIV